MGRTEEDEIYDLIVDMTSEIDPSEFQWHGGAQAAPEDHMLYRLLLFFMARAKEGKTQDSVVQAWEPQDPNEAVRSKLAEGGWTVVLKDLPNPSELAWAYSPERTDYAGAGFIPGEPKKFMSRAKPPYVKVCPIPSEMRKVMQEIASH